MDKRRFEALWRRCVDAAAAARGGALFDEILARYSEPHRRYHTPEHIDHCLGQFDLAAGAMDEPDAVEMALWFHDVVYETSVTDNELKSAEMFLARVDGDAPEDFRERVYELVMITVHRELPRTRDEKFMVDIDLSSFGLPWPRFVRDSIAVRDEFPAVPDAEFYPRQRVFLETLLARPSFCFTEFFRDRHEATARENITRHLSILSEKGLA